MRTAPLEKSTGVTTIIDEKFSISMKTNGVYASWINQKNE